MHHAHLPFVTEHLELDPERERALVPWHIPRAWYMPETNELSPSPNQSPLEELRMHTSKIKAEPKSQFTQYNGGAHSPFVPKYELGQPDEQHRSPIPRGTEKRGTYRSTGRAYFNEIAPIPVFQTNQKSHKEPMAPMNRQATEGPLW